MCQLLCCVTVKDIGEFLPFHVSATMCLKLLSGNAMVNYLNRMCRFSITVINKGGSKLLWGQIRLRIKSSDYFLLSFVLFKKFFINIYFWM